MTKEHAGMRRQSSHLPPPEVSSLLSTSNGKVYVIDKIKTPVDELGFTDQTATRQLLNETIDPDYKYPDITSRHHYLYTRKGWHNHPIDPIIATAVREFSGAQEDLFVQEHNYLHSVTIEPAVPPIDNIRIRYEDIRDILHLYAIGHEALKALQWATYTSDPHVAAHYQKKSEELAAYYLDYLEKVPERPASIIPDRQHLAQEGAYNAPYTLGRFTARHEIDFNCGIDFSRIEK